MLEVFNVFEIEKKDERVHFQMITLFDTWTITIIILSSFHNDRIMIYYRVIDSFQRILILWLVPV